MSLLLPAYIEDDEELQETDDTTKMPKDFGIDFETGQLTGETVEGLEAIKVWIWCALKTPRYRYCIYSWDYGSEFEELIGQRYSMEYMEAEIRRMTEECLLVNESIQGISDLKIEQEKDAICISFVVNTLYGDIKFSNQEAIPI